MIHFCSDVAVTLMNNADNEEEVEGQEEEMEVQEDEDEQEEEESVKKQCTEDHNLENSERDSNTIGFYCTRIP